MCLNLVHLSLFSFSFLITGIKNIFSVFLLSYKLKHLESLRETRRKSHFVLDFPRNFSFLSNFPSCFCNSTETRKCFVFLQYKEKASLLQIKGQSRFFLISAHSINLESEDIIRNNLVTCTFITFISNSSFSFSTMGMTSSSSYLKETKAYNRLRFPIQKVNVAFLLALQYISHVVFP